MLKVGVQQNWTKMYVYQTNVWSDLCEMMIAYLGECEHASEIAECPEISSDTVDDVKAWKEKRKVLLLTDFAEYLTAQVE